jgi:DNA-binding NarL/FixJ family response regulator
VSAPKIFLVEDFERFRRAVASIVRSKGWQVVGEASDGLEVIQKAEELHPDLILLDVGLPKLNGIESVQRILRVVPAAKILFISQDSSPDIVAEAFRLGAMGYVHKARVQRDLLPAIEAVLQGRHFFSENLEVPHFIESISTQAAHRHEVVFYLPGKAISGSSPDKRAYLPYGVLVRHLSWNRLIRRWPRLFDPAQRHPLSLLASL